MPVDDMLPPPGLTVIAQPGHYAALHADETDHYGRRRALSPPRALHINYDEILRLLDVQKALEMHLNMVIDHTQPHNSDVNETAREALDAVWQKIDFLRSHLEELYYIIPPHQRPPTEASAIKAEEVFSTPELLEIILLAGLSMREKLDAMRVQRCWRDAVKGSAKLKRSLGLSLSKKPLYYSPFAGRLCEGTDWQNSGQLPGGGRIYHRLSGLEGMTRWDLLFRKVVISIQNCPDDAQVLGSRVQSMVICNPPIHNLEVNVTSCCHCTELGQSSYLMDIQAESVLGFTMGEIARRTGEIKKRNLHCSSCKTQYTVGFMGAISLSPDDPLAKAHVEAMDAERRYVEELERLENERESAGTGACGNCYACRHDPAAHLVIGDSFMGESNEDGKTEEDFYAEMHGGFLKEGSDAKENDLGGPEWDQRSTGNTIEEYDTRSDQRGENLAMNEDEQQGENQGDDDASQEAEADELNTEDEPGLVQAGVEVARRLVDGMRRSWQEWRRSS